MCSQNKVTVKKRFRVKSSLPFKNTNREKQQVQAERPQTQTLHTHA